MNYPVTPAHVDPAITAPSESFRREVKKVLASLGLFVFVYLLLITAGVGLAVLCGIGGLGLIILKPALITLLLGLGLASLGVMVLFFLVKFIFRKVKVDRSHLVEVTRAEQPQLFAFIERLTTEVGSPFPKHIYLSDDVNASVFYDSGFWSMFLPVRKNLQIGLGLVNALTLAEFKAVLAHEFGHFSQRSMKLGSYVYNMNQVIFNLLYDNTGYGRALEKWGSISGYFAFFMNLTVGIIRGIQWVLQKMYGLINKTYLGLSRQMEFHADAVAAAAAGGNQLASALLKLDMANGSHQRVLQTYNQWIGRGWKAQNFYPDHRLMMREIATGWKVPVQHDLPVVTLVAYQGVASSRVIVHDQWASHPSTEDRVKQLDALGIDTSSVADSAWAVFQNADDVQARMTDWLYRGVKFSSPPQLVGFPEFRKQLQEELARYQYPDIYQGFYDSRAITAIDVDRPLVRDARSVADILADGVSRLPRKVEMLQTDIEALEAVKQEASGIQSFDLDGQRYPRSQAATFQEQLKTEREKAESDMAFADSRLLGLALHYANDRGEAEILKEAYREYRKREDLAQEVGAYYQDIMTILAPVYQNEMSLEVATDVQNKLSLHESRAKDLMKGLLKDPEAFGLMQSNWKLLEDYLATDIIYFNAKTGFNSEGLDTFQQALNVMAETYGNHNLAGKKQFLEVQAKYLV
ncbi:MAG: M48 family metalloprotease [Cyclobacteriaceae bacterium]|jgi:Zn-dependent protease with chaperone function